MKTNEYIVKAFISHLLQFYRHVANGEILGVTLLMEDVLQTGYQDVSLLTEHAANGEPGDKTKERKARSSSVRSIDHKRTSSILGGAGKIGMCYLL